MLESFNSQHMSETKHRPKASFHLLSQLAWSLREKDDWQGESNMGAETKSKVSPLNLKGAPAIEVGLRVCVCACARACMCVNMGSSGIA